MYVQVENRLASVGVCIDYDAITVLRDARRASYPCRGKKQMPQHLSVGFAGSIERINMLPRYDQYMRRGLRTDVIESYADVILVNPRRRNFTRNYLAKKTVVSHIVFGYYSTNGQDC